jgi:cell shape-determining protein MreC
LPEPSKDQYVKTMTNLDSQIEKLREEITTIKQKKEEKLKVRKEENAKDKDALNKSSIGNMSFKDLVAKKKTL